MALRSLLWLTSAFLSLIGTPALACFPEVGPFDVDYGKRAEVIVVGRITDYEKVRRDDCGRPGAMIQLCVYSRIFVAVDKVLAGKADKTIVAIVNKWPAGGLNDSATGFIRPLPSGQVLIALEDLSASGVNRNRPWPDGSIEPNIRWGIMTVVEKPCRSAFVFDPSSDIAKEFLAKWRQANKH